MDIGTAKARMMQFPNKKQFPPEVIKGGPDMLIVATHFLSYLVNHGVLVLKGGNWPPSLTQNSVPRPRTQYKSKPEGSPQTRGFSTVPLDKLS